MTPEPLFVGETMAARLLDMPPSEFLSHVEEGNLPPATEILPGTFRWRVAELKDLAAGNMIDGGEVIW